MEDIRDPQAGAATPEEAARHAAQEVTAGTAAEAGTPQPAEVPNGTEPQAGGQLEAEGARGSVSGQPGEHAGAETGQAPEAGAEVGDAEGGAAQQAQGAAQAPDGQPDSPEGPAAGDAAADGDGDGATGTAPVEQDGDGSEAKQAIAEQLAPTRLSRGQLVTGTVVQVADDHVLVDVGYKTDGTIPRTELRLLGGKRPDEVYQVGQEIPVVVIGVTDKGEGGLLLSHRRAVEREAWDRLRKAYEAGEPVEVPVVEQVKGGLVCDAGVRAFMPASHVERGYVADLSGYVGTTVRAKIIELDRSKHRVILSRKELLEEEARRRAEETLASLEEGQVRTGVVKGLTDFGAFIDLGGVDGLLHVSEMHWGRVEHPRDVLNEGETVQVKVLRVDRERGRISLSLKELMPDPWDDVERKYPPGTTVRGQVVRIVPFGAFVRLEPGVEGLVHISQLADRRVESPEEVVQEGQEVEVRVLRVQPEERRISLSMRPPAEPRRQAPRPERPRRERERERERSQARPAPAPAQDTGGGITIGEMFGDLLEETKDRLAESAGEASSGDQEG
ncbi:MAG: 30S ribosomal protein S1 [Bacillota bacterium]|nr:MAG: 30S ribosomal protein S1 [Bacillota bacterium]